MLTAILRGKAGRIASDGADQSWRSLFRQREDLLTSVFFSRIPYLSSESIAAVLAILMPTAGEEQLGEFLDITFWPKLVVDDARRFVEPDVVITLKNADILIEVKPPAGGPQYLAQWRAEIDAFANDQEMGSATGLQRPLHFLALGRNTSQWLVWKARLENEFSDQSLHVHATEWDDVRDGVAQLSQDAARSDRAVFSDWIDAFTLYGLVAPLRPFDEIAPLLTLELAIWASLFEGFSVPRQSQDWESLSEFAGRERFGVLPWE